MFETFFEKMKKNKLCWTLVACGHRSIVHKLELHVYYRLLSYALKSIPGRVVSSTLTREKISNADPVVVIELQSL